MEDLLQEYRAVIDEFHPELSKALRPGLPQELVIEKLSTLPFAISDDAIQLYSWADGTNLEGVEPHLIPISFFWPLDAAIESFENLLTIEDMLEEISPQAYRQSFRFLSDGSDGGYGFGSLDKPCDGRIISYDIHAEWTIAFNSLNDLIETAIEAYRADLLVEHEEWYIEGFYDLARKRYPELHAG